MAQANAGSGFRIVAREDYSDVTYMLEVAHPQMARAAQPGQFVIVMETEHGERIPLTIADFDRERGTITLVIQAVGKTTKEMQANLKAGDSLFAMVGPMGIPSHIGKAKKVVCVGGGLGVAPVYPQARAYKESGAYVIGVIGFRNKDLMFWQDKFGAVCDELIVCTDDGSAGIKGLVTEGIKQAAAKHSDIDEVVAIGPPDHDEGLRRDDPGARHQDHRQPEPGDGRRHRHVRRLPREGRRAGQVRLRRRAGLRRPPGRLRRPDGAPRPLQADRDARRSSAGQESCRIRADKVVDLKAAVLDARPAADA